MTEAAADATRRFYESLPRKRIAAGVICRDDRARVLLVRPTYKPTWELPGGNVEAGESPRAAAMREVLEELAVRLDIGELLIIDWLPNRPPKTEGLMLLFDGGRLDNTTTCRFSLPADELSEWAFVAADRLDAFLPAVIARRVRVGLARMEGGGTVYLESGRPPGSADDERLPRRGGEEAHS